MKKQRETILEWDLNQVLRFLVNRWRYEQARAEKLLIEYRRFMILSVEHLSETMPVSDEVDEVWHAHLLFTQDYAAFCDAVVGEYLHHRVPADEAERLQLATAYRDTIRIYRENFGPEDATAWAPGAQICWCETITRTKERLAA